MWSNGCVNELICGNHFTIHDYSKHHIVHLKYVQFLFANYTSKLGDKEKEMWCKGKSEGSSLGHSLSIQQCFHVSRGSTQFILPGACDENFCIPGGEKCLLLEVSWKHMAFVESPASIREVHDVGGHASASCRLWKKAQAQIRRLGPIFRGFGFLNILPPQKACDIQKAAYLALIGML